MYHVLHLCLLQMLLCRAKHRVPARQMQNCISRDRERKKYNEVCPAGSASPTTVGVRVCVCAATGCATII